MKIVVAEKISSSAIDILREEKRWTIVTPDQLDGRLASEIADADGLIVRSAVQADAALLEHAHKLRVIGRAGVGVDNVDLEAATRLGIAVMNTPGANAVAVAEHTMTMALAMARHLCRADALMHAGKWEKKSLQGTELRGKTLGIVGLGRIGMEVSRRARAFGMRLVAHDPFVSPEVARQAEIELTTLEKVLAVADYVTLHLALTPQSAGLINAETLRKMKKGARLINCARGELVDEPALVAALRDGHLAAAALDVFTEEPPKNSPLLTAPNVILTPHIGGSTHEAQEAVGVQIAVQVREFLRRGVMQNAVNVPSVSDEEYAELQPYMTLAERLGAFIAQATEGGLEEIGLQFSGPIASGKTQLVHNAALVGVLNSVLAEKANLVNASAMAEERGIRVRETAKPKVSGGSAGSVITVHLKTHQGEHAVRGTVLHGTSPRLLSVDGIDVEAPLERNLVYLRNRDVPGVIGKIGTILGEAKINIANFSLGRAEQAARAAVAPASGGHGSGGEAVCVVHVDSRVPDNVLHKLRGIAAITLARAIRLG
ncbi:MAG TPA: phosphoglycerate dehydrogenase [Terriglobales bacterium]